MLIEEAAHRTRDAVAQAQALTHDLAAQIEVAVFETQLLVHRLIELKGQGLAAIEDLDLLGDELDGARSQVGIGGASRTRAYAAFDTDDEFIAQSFGLREHRSLLGIKHHLQQALAVAQVDENDAAVIAPPMHPAGHLDFFLREGRAHLAAVMATHGGRSAARRHPK